MNFPYPNKWNLKKASSFWACFFLIIFNACSQEKEIEEGFDPLEFAKEFNSVCKVGVRGGDGTLIKKNWVLTAGHVAEGMFIESGGDLMVYFDNGSQTGVKSVFLHPKYESMGKFDIALLELKEDINAIPALGIYVDRDELGKEIFLAGHGDKPKTDGTWIKDGKLRAYKNVIDKVNETHIIFDFDAPGEQALKEEGTSGPGDSGGPAMVQKDGEYLVAGVSSMGEPGENGPATYGAIEYFVRVSSFQEWIKNTIKDPNSSQALDIKNIKLSQPGGEEIEIQMGGNKDLSDSPQAQYAKMILAALEDYSEDKLIKAISETYDPEILKNRLAEQIVKNKPVMTRELQGAKFVQVLSESEKKISLMLKKGQEIFGLDLFFRQSSGKIEQMAFGKFD